MFVRIKNVFKKPMTIIGIIVIIIGIVIWNRVWASTKAPQYQTAQVTRETLISSVSESGTVSIANRTSVITQAKGSVIEVDVKNGDTVAAGQKVAVLNLDVEGQQKQSQALATYLSAQSNLNQANASLYSLQTQLFQTNQAFVNDTGIANPTDQDKQKPKYIEENATWLAAEAAYKNQQGVIAQAQASLNSAWLSYQLTSATVTAPTNGMISDITIAPGMQIGSATTTTTAISSQAIASIHTMGNPVISISLSELDAVKVKGGQKATVTFDALPNKTFTGKVLGVDTSGSVSSGVTTYAATIQLDLPNDAILPNMSATANIIINVKTDVLGVPSSAIQTTNGQTTVRVLQDGQLTSIPVTIGIVSDVDTEIVSGLSEGQKIVTSIIIPTSSTSTTSTSPFSGGLRGGFGGGSLGGGRGGGATGR